MLKVFRWLPVTRSLIPLLCVVGVAIAAAQSAGDGKDHPLLTRMPGFSVDEKSVKDFDAVDLNESQILGKIKDAKFPLHYEGKVTVIKYVDPKEASSNLAIYRNVQAALKQVGAEQLNGGFAQTADDIRLADHVFRVPAKSGGEPTYVVLFINSPQWYSLTYIEPKPMEQSVKAGQLAEELKAKGVATLHINFETNKSVLPADGQAAVKEIVALMKSDPLLKLSIEGHTDNVGGAAANKKLSDDRARSVQAAVVAAGVDAKRLGAKGFGAEVPVADNRTEDGRAKNRRVELVKLG